MSSEDDSASPTTSAEHWDCSLSPPYGVCPECSVTHPCPINFAALEFISHVIVVIRSHVVVQVLENGSVCIPCIRYSKGRYPDDSCEAPEVSMLGAEIFGTQHLQILHLLERPTSKDWACIAEVSHIPDESHVLGVVEQRENLSLVSANDLLSLEFVRTFSGDTLQKHAYQALAWGNGTISLPDNFPPWYRLGFCADAREWIIEHLPNGFHAAIENISTCVVKTWALGCTLLITRGDNTDRKLYFKACVSREINEEWPKTLYDHASEKGIGGGCFGKEIGMIRFMCMHKQEIVPKLIACDENRGFMLSEDGGCPMSEKKPSDELKLAFLKQYMQLQKWSSDYVETMLQAGFGDRRLSQLNKNLKEVMRSTTLEDLPSLDGYYDDIDMICQQVERKTVREAVLVHGDLHGGNVLLRDDAMCIIDWSDGCISHPIIDIDGSFGWIESTQYAREMGISEDVFPFSRPLALLNGFVSQARAHETACFEQDEFGEYAREALTTAIHLITVLRDQKDATAKHAGMWCEIEK